MFLKIKLECNIFYLKKWKSVYLYSVTELKCSLTVFFVILLIFHVLKNRENL